ncbi:11009_t:CDS:2, partial [Racocetra persica]
PTTEISLDQPSYSNDPNNPWNLVTKYYTVNQDGSVNENPFLIESPNTSTNMFSTLISAILAVYIMLTGDTSSLSPWALNDDITLTILVVIFSFFTTIYLMNLFIGLLSDAINETNNKEYFLIQRAEVLTEIELFYMLPYQRRKHNWFPNIIFYEAHVHKLRDLIRDIQNDKWLTLEKPQISSLLLKIINIEDESDTEISQIKKQLE